MPKKAIQLSDHFTYSRLLRFVLPCIGTMLFTSIYGICLLYTSDAADEEDSVDLGGSRVI